MFSHGRRFADRFEAGKELADKLTGMASERPAIYALPRGGVPVSVEIARALRAPLDLIFVRKIGAPQSPEVALAAIVDGENPQMVVNERIKRVSGASNAYLEQARKQELAELERRRRRYLGDRETVDPAGRTVIIVDDGLATGATMKAAILAMRQKDAKKICVAIPVAPTSALDEIRQLVDTVVCLHSAENFGGVGAFYDDFHQLSDQETTGLMQQVWSGKQDS